MYFSILLLQQFIIIILLVDKLLNFKYKTSKYSLYKIYEPKERIIYRLPYYLDRIAHHAIMNIVNNYAKYFRINFIRNGKAYYADSRDKTLFYSIHKLNHFPINFKITKYDWRIYTKSKKENVKPQT